MLLPQLLKKLRASRTALNKKAVILKLLEIVRKEAEHGEEQLTRRGKQSCEDCKEAEQTWEKRRRKSKVVQSRREEKWRKERKRR